MNAISGIRQNSLMNVHRINQSFANQNKKSDSVEGIEKQRRDSVDISPQGKMNSMLESLMEQKMRVTEQKNSLISSTIDSGESMSSIKSQIESYEEQLKNIDDQISNAMTEDIQKPNEKVQKSKDNKPKNKEEIENGKLMSLTSLSTDLSQVKIASSVKSSLDGIARVLEFEIELDKTRGGSRDVIEKKEEKLASLQQKSIDLLVNISDEIEDTQGKMNENTSGEVANKSEDKLDDNVSQKPDDKLQDKLEEKDIFNVNDINSSDQIIL